VDFLCDEAASLGHFQPVDDGLAMGRGFGVRLTLIYQSMGQLRKCYPDGQEQTLLSNVSQVFFAANDQVTLDYVSSRLGEETIVVESGGSSSGTSRQVPTFASGHHGGSTTYSCNQNDNWSQVGRKLLKPEEVAALPPSTAITFTPGVPPVWTTLVRYFEEPSLGRPPGPWARIRAAAMTVYASCFLLVIGCVAAFLLVKADLSHHPLVPPEPAAPPAIYELPVIEEPRPPVPTGRVPMPKQRVRRSVH
jgi:type IV secretion system protein VirD4